MLLFYKQKTAYYRRISDWRSDVCAADLGSPSSTSASAPGAIASAAPALDLQALLIGIVAERTGYPHEMLGLDADLEADLGIDSIKRVEILGSFQKALPAAAGTQMQDGMEHFTKANSLNPNLATASRFTISAPPPHPQPAAPPSAAPPALPP